jgi:cell division septation protein DedD
MGRRFARIVALMVAVLSIAPWRASVAQTVPDPSIFALYPFELPAGAQIVDSRVATNGAVIDQHLQSGRPLPDGRVTGYYLQAKTLTASGGTASVISYLASIFTTNRTAQDAFADQQDFWQSEVVNFGNSAYEEDLGDFFLAHLYTLRDANGNTDSELFFQRGAVFIEVTLQNFGTLSRDERKALLLGIAHTLESRANGTPAPLTPTVTDTPLPTATATVTPKPTRTPRPTATPTRVKRVPTRTPTPTPQTAYGHPVQESVHCKKGYRLVHGRCTKAKAGKP